MKLRALAVLAALATVRANTDADAMGLTVIDFDAMQKGECTAQPAATSASSSSSSASDDYAANYDEYYKDSSSSTADATNKALCDCLASSGVQSAVGPSAYAAALQSFMDCVAKADAAAMKRITKYKHSLLPDTNATTTSAANPSNETTQDVPAAAAAETETTSSSSEDSISVSNVSDSAEWPFSDLSSTEAEVGSASVLMGGVDPTDDRFGHAAMYILFIGVSVLLFVCAWFVKGSLHAKWGKGGYDAVSYSSEADADDRGDPYNHHAAGGDDWEDMYDHSAASFKQDKQQKGKFGDWAQYNAV